jgi:hypothetical protein
MKDVDITLNKEDVIKMLKEVRSNMYHSVAKAKRRHSHRSMRPSEQAMTEVRWSSQLIALDIAVAAVQQIDHTFAAKGYNPQY